MVSNMTRTWLDGVVKGFTVGTLPISAVSYAVNQEGASVGSIIRVPFVSNESGSLAFTEAGGYSLSSNNGVVGKDITLDTVLYQPWYLSDSQTKNLTPQSIEMLGVVAGERLSSDVLSHSFANVITQTNFPDSGSYTSTNYTGSILPLATLDKFANERNWPKQGRNLIMGTDLEFAIKSNDKLVQAYSVGTTQTIQGGSVPQLYGFNCYGVNFTLPNSDKGIALNANGMLFGMSYFSPEDRTNVIYSERIVTPNGLVLGYVEFAVPQYRHTFRAVECLFGAAAGAPRAVYHIK